MKLEYKTLTIALIAIVLAVPVASAFKHRTIQLKIEKSQNTNLQLQLESKQKLLEQKELQIKKDEQEKQDLQKKLQSKREAEAKLALQAQVAPVFASVGSGNCESYRGLVAQYNWNTDIALAIMRAESGCRPNAVSPTNDHGLMQINQGLDIYGSKIYDPAFNVKIAYEQKYAKGGWSHWTVYNTGAYRKYM